MLGLEGPSENNHSNVPPTATSPLLNSDKMQASLLSPSCKRQEMLAVARYLNFVVTVEKP
jgi:hypothetical protein